MLMGLYKIVIPQALHPDLKRILEKKVYLDYRESRFLLEVYYRYIDKLGPGQDPKIKARMNQSCPGCVNTGISALKNYFKNA